MADANKPTRVPATRTSSAANTTDAPEQADIPSQANTGETVFEKQGPEADPVVHPHLNASGRDGADEDPTTSNPAIVEGDRLAPNATTSGNSPVPNGTGFHCSMCGQPVTREGAHFDEDGDIRETGHVFGPVVADDWAGHQNEADVKAAEEHAAKKAARKTNPLNHVGESDR